MANISRRTLFTASIGSFAGFQANQLLAQGGTTAVSVKVKNADPTVTIAEDFWMPWATDNQNGSLRGPRYAPSNSRIVGLRSREQQGYGLVNIQFAFRYLNGKGTYWSDWLTDNFRGTLNPAVSIASKKSAKGIEVKEQHGFGLVDARLIYSGGKSDWLTKNANGQSRSSICDDGIMTGLLAREQDHFGLVNIRCHCS